jgi:glyoxylase-like metal-dependent hydrolase (beta-lactamase superfamily II)/rhodanese-related sulfurtransferase
MIFEQFYLGCLAHASYLVGDGGECAIVDPQRDVDHYLDAAARFNCTIKYVIETHLHADFVSGHRELAARTGATIVFGANANAAFDHLPVHDGDTLGVGNVELRALETPGHTPESISWLVVDDDGAPRKVLTGDTLFIGDVGRPDLAGGRGFTPQQMAAALYDSIHGKLLALPDDVEVWPAHGAGSACGKNISKERSSTIGVQRKTNWALQRMMKEEFVNMLTSEMPPAPPYFSRDAEINRIGARPLGEVTAARITAEEALRDGKVLLDVRDEAAFAAGHARGAINIGLGGQFASWAGTLIPAGAPIVVIAENEARAAEAIMRLARVGIESVIGWLTSDDELPADELAQISVEELRNRGVSILDVRQPGEYAAGHVPGATNVPLGEVPNHLDDFDRHAPLAVICGGGYRSSAAASLLQRAGHTRLFNVVGGTAAWVRAGFATERPSARAAR